MSGSAGWGPCTRQKPQAPLQRGGKSRCAAPRAPPRSCENVTAALKPWGIKTGQVWGQTDEGEGKNRRGIERADVVAAIARRGADGTAG